MPLKWSQIAAKRKKLLKGSRMLLLSPLHKIGKGFDNWDLLVSAVLYAVFGFDRIFCGLRALDVFFYGFAVSKRPQCPLPKEENSKLH